MFFLKVVASVEVEAEDTKAAVVIEMVGDGVATMVLMGDGAVPDLYYGPVKQPVESHLASVECIGFLYYGHLATVYPRRPGPEVHMAAVYNSYVGEVCDEHTCYACDI